MEHLLNYKLTPTYNKNIKFNDKTGWLSIRCIDSSNDKDFIKFDFKENFKYDFSKISNTSRSFTLVNVDIEENKKEALIISCNNLLQDIRKNTQDVILTAFKGNTKSGVRRRRLDFNLARAIIEKSLL